ncbi:hypothetical protein QO004_002733 [Rhizobium mesoamericanum]|nr:hypothetical protein [Rhizobium mesoamericanum]
MNLDVAPGPPDDRVEPFDFEKVSTRRRRQLLFAARKKVFPKRAKGRFRRFQSIVTIITLGDDRRLASN